MTPEQREIFRDTILRSLKASRGMGMALLTLEVALRAAGFRQVTPEDLEAELAYFTDKGLVTEAAKSHSVGNRIWRITAAGIDDLERRGF